MLLVLQWLKSQLLHIFDRPVTLATHRGKRTNIFCYLGDTSGVNLFQTIFLSIKILDRFQVNKKLQKICCHRGDMLPLVMPAIPLIL